jgi:two-component system, LuxR family, response regulator FixJ
LPSTESEIILVEDDPSVLRALCRILKISGLNVRAFARPSDLLATKIPESGVCLIFDVHLPEMSGVDLFEKITKSGCRCPLILITAHVDVATEIMTKRANAAPLLTKPFSRNTLLAAIRQSFASAEC